MEEQTSSPTSTIPLQYISVCDHQWGYTMFGGKIVCKFCYCPLTSEEVKRLSSKFRNCSGCKKDFQKEYLLPCEGYYYTIEEGGVWCDNVYCIECYTDKVYPCRVCEKMVKTPTSSGIYCVTTCDNCIEKCGHIHCTKCWEFYYSSTTENHKCSTCYSIQCRYCGESCVCEKRNSTN